VGDIDDAGDAENERQPGAHEKQARCRGEPVEGLKEKGFKTHGTGASATGARGTVLPSSANNVLRRYARSNPR
jgi:hypothetical protein